MLSNILNNTLSSYTYSNLYPIMHDILGNLKKKYPIMLYIFGIIPYCAGHIRKYI